VLGIVQRRVLCSAFHPVSRGLAMERNQLQLLVWYTNKSVKGSTAGNNHGVMLDRLLPVARLNVVFAPSTGSIRHIG
jgi:hypothetical protein